MDMDDRDTFQQYQQHAFQLNAAIAERDAAIAQLNAQMQRACMGERTQAKQDLVIDTMRDAAGRVNSSAVSIRALADGLKHSLDDLE